MQLSNFPTPAEHSSVAWQLVLLCNLSAAESVLLVVNVINFKGAGREGQTECHTNKMNEYFLLLGHCSVLTPQLYFAGHSPSEDN